MPNWYPDKGMAKLNSQMKVKYPGIVIGVLAGGGHVATWPTTDHAPEPDGSVDGSDYMLGKSFTKEKANEFVNTLIRNRDHRINYIIWYRRIISSTVKPWVWRDYHGTSSHTDHVHLSVNDKHENDASPWNLGGLVYPQTPPLEQWTAPVLKYGNSDADFDGYNSVYRLQALLNLTTGAGLTVDGDYGAKTAAAVKKLAKGTDGKTVDLGVWVQLFGLTKIKDK